tara:strand:- start:559 stop:825 length:267 start_codon:yes stop_codon:yes gene_type:complete
MKKIVYALIIVLLLASCSDVKTFTREDGTELTVEPYGLFDKDEIKNNDVVYKVNTWNVVASVVFIETAIVPIYILGWDLWEPVALKTE